MNDEYLEKRCEMCGRKFIKHFPHYHQAATNQEWQETANALTEMIKQHQNAEHFNTFGIKTL